MKKEKNENPLRFKKSSTVAIAILVLFQSNSAYAYLDPGSGSMLLQGLIAAFAIAGGGISMFWGKVRSLFKKGERREKGDIEINKKTDRSGK